MTGDLHCHTTLSDGSLGIEEVIVQAKRMGLDFLAITDHDTLSSSNRAQILGERYGKGNDRKGNGKISYPCRRCTALHEKLKEHF